MPRENPESPSQSLTPAQITAIKRAKKLCPTIIGNHPEIAQDYRDGLTYREIAIKYNIDRYFKVGIRIAAESVRLAVKTLIPDEKERTGLVHEHRSKNGLDQVDQRKGIFGLSPKKRSANSRRAGLITQINRTGVFSLSKDELSAIGKRNWENGIGIAAITPERKRLINQKIANHSKKNGKGIFAQTKEKLVALGKMTYEKRIGIHGMTTEEKQAIGKKTYAEGKGCHSLTTEQLRTIGLDNCRKGIGMFKQTKEENISSSKKGRLESGKSIPWDMLVDSDSGLNEGDYCDKLMQESHDGPLKDKANKIAQHLNEKFHGGRQVRTINSVYHRWKKFKAAPVV